MPTTSRSSKRPGAAGTLAPYRTIYPAVAKGPDAGAECTMDTATDWPDWSSGEDSSPIHLDTCQIMRDPDADVCTCGLELLTIARARFTLKGDI